MVAPADRDPTAKGPLLARILRAVRNFRRRLLVDVARELNIKKRTYEHFEGGFGPLNVERVHAFAELLRVDPYGVLAALEICSPEFAVRTAENKLMTMFYLQLQEFDERTGDAITLLDAYALLDAFREMFAKLEVEARKREELVSRKLPGPPDDSGEKGS
jgi:transcriptional regulator with XRE-family HTH domain